MIGLRSRRVRGPVGLASLSDRRVRVPATSSRGPGGIRTPNLRFRRATLLSVELQARMQLYHWRFDLSARLKSSAAMAIIPARGIGQPPAGSRSVFSLSFPRRMTPFLLLWRSATPGLRLLWVSPPPRRRRVPPHHQEAARFRVSAAVRVVHPTGYPAACGLGESNPSAWDHNPVPKPLGQGHRRGGRDRTSARRFGDGCSTTELHPYDRHQGLISVNSNLEVPVADGQGLRRRRFNLEAVGHCYREPGTRNLGEPTLKFAALLSYGTNVSRAAAAGQVVFASTLAAVRLKGFEPPTLTLGRSRSVH